MKKILLAILLSVFVFSLTVSAHGGMMDFSDRNTSFDMMESVEGQIVPSDVHEEMEGLMDKMMSGEMTEEEVSKMAELMNQYPGANSMMMSRYAIDNRGWNNAGWGHMGWSGGGMSVGFWFMGLISIVWLIVGVLAIAWFIKKLSK